MFTQKASILLHHLDILRIAHDSTRLSNPSYSSPPDFLEQCQPAFGILCADIFVKQHHYRDRIFDRHACSGKSKRQDWMACIAYQHRLVRTPTAYCIHVEEIPHPKSVGVGQFEETDC